MNHYEQLISDFLKEYKEVSLDKIGIIKTIGGYDEQTRSIPVDFIFDRKAVTSPELIDYIVQKTAKSRMLIISDLESHLSQAREFINIGKTYEISDAGFIKKNNSGVYELIPASQAVKAQKNFSKPVQKKRPQKKAASSAVQVFTLIIVLAILSGLGWEAYQFFIKPKVNNAEATAESEAVDSTTNKVDTVNKNDSIATAAITDTSAAKPIDTTVYKDDDIIDAQYIFETTNLLLRAQSRTAKLIGYGNDAGYDSVANGPGKIYSLYILKKTKIADTLRIKDSIAKFLQKPVTIKIKTKA